MTYTRARMHSETTAEIHHATRGVGMWYLANVKSYELSCAVCGSLLLKGKRMYRPIDGSADRICTPCVAELCDR